MIDKKVIEAMEKGLPEDFCGDWEPHEAHSFDETEDFEGKACRGIAEPAYSEGEFGYDQEESIPLTFREEVSSTIEKIPLSDEEVRVEALRAASSSNASYIRPASQIILDAIQFEEYIRKGQSK